MASAPTISYKINPHVLVTSAPPIPKASTWSSAYEPTAVSPLINLAQGVPGQPPPLEFQTRLSESALDNSTTTYGDLRGDELLREAFRADFNEVYRIEDEAAKLGKDEVVMTAGANLAFYATVVSLAQAGDEIILPTPWYFNNSMTLDQLGIRTVPLECDAPAFLPSVSRAEALISEKTRAIVLVTPNNPTGAIYPDELLNTFAALAKKRRIALVLDETYREFLEPSHTPPHTLFQDPSWRSYLIHMFSFSKSFAIPGHRLGALAACSSFLVELHKTLDCLQINPPRPAQSVVAWAIPNTRSWRHSIRDQILDRQKVFEELLDGVEGWEYQTGGGYFVYVKHPYEGVSSESVAESLAGQVGVVVLPGSFFGPKMKGEEVDRFLRFCKYALGLMLAWILFGELILPNTFLAIANVDVEILRLVPDRLRKLSHVRKSFGND